MKSFLRVSSYLKDDKVDGIKQTIRVLEPTYLASGKDIMKKGNDFYAIANPRTGMWEFNEQIAYEIIDNELYSYAEQHFKHDPYDLNKYLDSSGHLVRIQTIDDSKTGQLKIFKDWLSKLGKNFNFKSLDEELTFLSDEVTVDQYRSKRLSYDIKKGSIENYDKLMSTLYSLDNRHKIEWSIGSVLAGWKEAKKNDHICVLYGSPGSGKSTILDIIEMIFENYWAPFEVDAVVNPNRQFAKAAFKNNPLVAIQDDGSLKRIDTEEMNKIASHSMIEINEKGKGQYNIIPRAICFIATNDTVDLSDSKNGMNRRLLDIYPSGNKIAPRSEYFKLKDGIKFELSGIAYHCLDVYKKLGSEYYSNYVPEKMQLKTNYIHNFMLDHYDQLKMIGPISRGELYKMYKIFCDEQGLVFKLNSIQLGEQILSYGYFKNYSEIPKKIDGVLKRNVFWDLNPEKFEIKEYKIEISKKIQKNSWLVFKDPNDIFRKAHLGCPAQYAVGEKDIPEKKWSQVETKLNDLDESKVHYILTQSQYPNEIVIDFDIPDENGEKSLEKNLEAASLWPETYAELSKSGKGIHLHYIYDGDASKLSAIYAPNIEIKVFSGNTALRRKLTKCNDISIATISTGLPLKGDNKMAINWDGLKNDKQLRKMIEKNLVKGYHAATKPSVDYIYSLLEEAYGKGLHYDVTDLRPDILAFASGSTHQADYCIKLVGKMKFKSEEPSENPIEETSNDVLTFYDVEVFPNLFVVVYKDQGEKKKSISMINPSPNDIAKLCKRNLVGFNCRRYDNHILYARMLGYSNERLFDISQKIINKSANCFFSEAYSLSYTDILDFSSEKKSLKKFEIELDIHHQENHYPWDQPISEDHWQEIVEYCTNDVIATEAVFNARKDDFVAREILATAANKLCPSIKSTVNDSTNTLTTRIIFRGDKNANSKLVYTDLATGISTDGTIKKTNKFPGYSFQFGKSTFMGEEVGEGGYVYSEPGMYGNVALLDVASMHPHSIKELNIFGEYTKNFTDLMDARIAVKHKDTKTAKTILNGALADYIGNDISNEQSKKLAKALKIAINSVYGLTCANFDNPFRDSLRNKDNIVAKRGALFMIQLKNELIKRGYHVVHIKTDSVKIADATEEQIKFVQEYGEQYGYSFEHEATFEKYCLINDAVYICKVKEGNENGAGPGEWSATGVTFQHPFIFKTLFSKQPVTFKDMCETKSVTTDLYLDFNEKLPDVSEFEKLKKLRENLSSSKKITKSDQVLLDSYIDISDEELDKKIATGHNYHFVGKVGKFTPMQKGVNAGYLVRISKEGDKYSAATGSKGYLWMESEMVKELNIEDKIDISYYQNLVDDAKKEINKYGDFDWFVSDQPYISIVTDELPF